MLIISVEIMKTIHKRERFDTRWVAMRWRGLYVLSEEKLNAQKNHLALTPLL